MRYKFQARFFIVGGLKMLKLNKLTGDLL